MKTSNESSTVNANRSRFCKGERRSGAGFQSTTLRQRSGRNAVECIPAGLAAVVFLCAIASSSVAAPISLETAPPVVIKTSPAAGATDVDPSLNEIRVTYSKPMQDGSWSWSTWGEGNFPEMIGKPRYLSDGRTCVLTVKLEPGRFYATWLNSEKFRNFKDADGRPAVPYLLTFRTAGGHTVTNDQEFTFESRDTVVSVTDVHRAQGVAVDPLPLLNADQRAVIAWTDRQFRSYYDTRTFAGWSSNEVDALELKCIDALNGPRSREYYAAINTLGALRTTKGLPRLRELAFERVDKNNRDRWMSVRVLGILGDRQSIPDLIHLVYHGNQNTHWWAQIALVQLTGQNFGGDWEAWEKWWNASGGQPVYDSEIIRWWDGQADTVEELRQTLAEGDRKFLESLN